MPDMTPCKECGSEGQTVYGIDCRLTFTRILMWRSQCSNNECDSHTYTRPSEQDAIDTWNGEQNAIYIWKGEQNA